MEKLFNENTRLVYSVYNSKIAEIPNAHSMKDDLIQIGMLTLWKCCTQFDPDRGTKFSTYAYNSIHKNMLCALTRENKKSAYLVSIDLPVKASVEEQPITFGDIIASPVNIASQTELETLVEQASKEFGARCEQIVKLVREGYTQVEIAQEMNITKAYVNKILKRFRKLLKNTLFVEYNKNTEVKTNE